MDREVIKTSRSYLIASFRLLFNNIIVYILDRCQAKQFMIVFKYSENEAAETIV